MFHLSDGFYFGRADDGCIVIEVRTNDHENRLLADTYTDAAGFASVMATLSKRGEDSDTWQEALSYLERADV